MKQTYFLSSFTDHNVRDRREMPQVLFVSPSEKEGEGVVVPENTKPEKKPEEKGRGKK